MLKVKPAKGLQGQCRVPGDKSISHRALMLGAIARGTTHIQGLLESADCLGTLEILKSLGSDITRIGPGEYIVQSVGQDQLREPEEVLDAGNSGTTIRLLLGLVSTRPHFLCSLGMLPAPEAHGSGGKAPQAVGGPDRWPARGMYAPIAVKGGPLQPGHIQSPVASAQVKSAVLLAGLGIPGTTTVTEPALSRDHTERMLTYLGCPVEREGTTVGVTGPRELEARPITIPGDFSSAAFLLAAAVLLPDSVVTIENVNLNPTRTGFLDVLRRMRARWKSLISGRCAVNRWGTLPLDLAPYRDVRSEAISFLGSSMSCPWWPCWAVRPKERPW